MDPNDTKTYPTGCSSNVNSSVASTENSSKYSSTYANYRPAAGDATYAVYHEIETATTPTVIETPCAIEWDDSATNGAITVNANVAILAQGGFTTGGDWASPGLVGQYTSSTYDVYMVVPYSGSGTYPVNGEPIADCPTARSPPRSRPTLINTPRATTRPVTSGSRVVRRRSAATYRAVTRKLRT